MDLELKNTNTADSLLNALYAAQLIANTFAKGLEDNNCLVISTIQLHQRINDTYKDVVDLIPPVFTEPDKILNQVVNRPAQGISPILANAINNSKEKCFNCKLELPKVDFNIDLDFSLEDMKSHIQLYKDLFLKIQLNPCQAIDVFKYQCIPDILKLIALLLTAYLAINSIKKLGGLSLSGFIKGIISALLGKLLGNINISLNLGQTNLSCFLDYIDLIQKAIPSTDNILNNISSSQALGLVEMLPTDLTEELFVKYLGNNVTKAAGVNYSKQQLQTLVSAIPSEDLVVLLNINGLNNSFLQGAGDGLQNGSRFIDRQIDELQDKIKNTQDGIDNIFKKVSDTVKEAIASFNAYIEQIQSLKSYFECEATRNSDDLLTIMKQLSEIIQILNLFSSVVYALAKKEARGICRSNKTINRLSNSTPLTEDQLLIKDFLQDYYQSQVEIANTSPDNIEVLVYKKPVAFGLPKISLLDCSIDNFIKEHTLDAVLELAIQDVLQESNLPRTILDNSPWESFTIDLNNSITVNPEVKALTELLYSKPDNVVQQDQVASILNKDTLLNLKPNYDVANTNIKNNESVKCKSIDDVLGMLENISRN